MAATNEEYQDDGGAEQNCVDENLVNLVGKGALRWQPKGKGKGKSRFEEVCWN